MQAIREASLAREASWSFAGRLAVSQGNNGGSARIEWRQQGGDFDIRLSAPITGQSWRLRNIAGKASLEGLEEGVLDGAPAQALLLKATGWRIPLDAMTAWVRGARAAGDSEVSYAADGLPSTLTQGEWAVEFRDWVPGDLPLPRKVFARGNGASVRLQIERWEHQ